MYISQAQIERFTEHVLELEAQRRQYAAEGQEEYVKSGRQMLFDMLYTARFFDIPLPLEYRDGYYVRTQPKEE